jgi:hypothetical protein
VTGPPAEGDGTVVAEWPRNSREVIRIELGSYRGQEVVSIRSWYEGADGERRPSRSGITLAIKHLRPLAAGISDALQVARERGLIGDSP